MIRDDFDRRVSSWMDDVARGAAPDTLLNAVLTTTRDRHPRPAWLVLARGGGISSTGSGQRIPRRWVVRVVVVGLIVLALVAGFLLTGIGRNPATGNAIFFVRTDTARSADLGFVIGADGAGERAVPGGFAIPSRDGRMILVEQLVKDPSPAPGAETWWRRPAVINADGTGLRLLDAYPGRKMHLAPIAWSPDGTRILVSSGSEDVNPIDVGLYTVRASDGGDLQRILVPAGSGGGGDGYSPDGTRILSGIFVVGTDGKGLTRLLPVGWIPVDLDFWDDFSADWSPDGEQLVFAATAAGASGPALYVVDVDGRNLREIVSPSVGALSARWSPSGQQIAFTSGRFGAGRTPAGKELTGNPQVWVVNPDGSGAIALTRSENGSTSITPVWSPDGTRLLFQRKVGDEVSLWTMRADGKEPVQLTTEPVAADYVGRYGWTSLQSP